MLMRCSVCKNEEECKKLGACRCVDTREGVIKDLQEKENLKDRLAMAALPQAYTEVCNDERGIPPKFSTAAQYISCIAYDIAEAMLEEKKRRSVR